MRFPGFEGEWVKVKLEDVTEKINSGKTPLGGQSTYLSEGIIFIRSQNVNNDQLELSSPIFISEEVNNGMKNSVVKPNDILLNITGASLGRSCVVPEDFKVGNVNQHVCIIRSKKDYTPRFIQPILSSAKGQAIFESLQTGSGREGLNFESIKKIELDFPTLDEQKRIADFLSLIDQRIQTQNKIIEGLKSLKNIVRYQLFNNLFLNQDVPTLQVKDILEYEQPGKYIVSSEDYKSDNSLIPVLTANKGFILGYTQETFGIYDKGECIIFDDFTLDMKYVDFPFKVKSSAIKILKAVPSINLKFIFEYLVFLNMSSTDHKRHYISEIAPMELCVPKYKLQDQIARLLTTYDYKLKTEKKIYNLLFRQKDYLQRQLFI